MWRIFSIFGRIVSAGKPFAPGHFLPKLLDRPVGPPSLSPSLLSFAPCTYDCLFIDTGDRSTVVGARKIDHTERGSTFSARVRARLFIYDLEKSAE